MEFSELLDKIVKVRTNMSNVGDEEWVTGRLAAIDDRYIKLVLRSGTSAFILIDDIRFLAACQKQV